MSLVVISVLVSAYVLFGALDLGVGLLLPLVARGTDRDAVIAFAVRPWSSGATWTLFGFALLVAGLPASLESLRALWPPLVVALLALGLRGAAGALRPHVLRQDLLDALFGLASLCAVGCQGLVLGWFVGGLGAGLPARHAGPLGWISVWGVLCAAGLVALYALVGAGWLVAAGRAAVRVFGREVGHAAVLGVVAAVVVCAAWSLPTGVADRVFAGDAGRGSASAGCAVLVIAAAASCWVELWSRRTILPAAAGAVAVAASLAALAALPPWHPEVNADDRTALLAFVLVLGSPLLAVDAWRRRSALRRTAADGPARIEGNSHAGRRSGSVANSLHLS